MKDVIDTTKTYMDATYPGVLVSISAKPAADDGGYVLEAEVIDPNTPGAKVFKEVIDEEFVGSTEFRELREYSPIKLGLGMGPYVLTEKGEEKSFMDTHTLVDYVFAAGKKGQTISRYKGLGEMNPEQLWETTMHSERRTLLQVRVEDAYTADEIFSTLMGEDVEVRRNFIQGHAQEVRNLDI